jgi:hypothetical protein
MFGGSFVHHVLGGYQFLLSFYAPGDKIYIFGFSRGAYTARFLSEMIDNIGLLSRGNEEMIRFAWDTFSDYQRLGGKSPQDTELDPEDNVVDDYSDTESRYSYDSDSLNPSRRRDRDREWSASRVIQEQEARERELSRVRHLRDAQEAKYQGEQPVKDPAPKGVEEPLSTEPGETNENSGPGPSIQPGRNPNANPMSFYDGDGTDLGPRSRNADTITPAPQPEGKYKKDGDLN